MKTTLYTGSMAISDGLKIPSDKITFEYGKVNNTITISLGFDYKLTPEQEQTFGLKLAVQGCCCGWWIYTPTGTQDLSTYVES